MKCFFLLILLLTSCAKPTIVQIKQDNDDKLSCHELVLALAETIKFKEDAEAVREGSGANMTRVMLFWPAMLKSMFNADTAVNAANDRIYHLQVISMKKKCNNQVIVKETGVLSKFRELKMMLDTGAITQNEYELAKKKVLNEKKE